MVDAKEYFNVKDYPREFEVTRQGTYPMYIIKAKDKREVPQYLSGQYSSTREANIAIDRFLFIMEQDAIKKAKSAKRRELTAAREAIESSGGSESQ